eukprot:6267528-Prymnesium_polylepis.2
MASTAGRLNGTSSATGSPAAASAEQCSLRTWRRAGGLRSGPWGGASGPAPEAGACVGVDEGHEVACALPGEHVRVLREVDPRLDVVGAEGGTAGQTCSRSLAASTSCVPSDWPTPCSAPSCCAWPQAGTAPSVAGWRASAAAARRTGGRPPSATGSRAHPSCTAARKARLMRRRVPCF